MEGSVSMSRFTFILIPGSGGSAWYWHLVAPKLEQRGHEAIPISLPAADNTAGLPEYAAAVVHAIGNREPRRVVLVAQSLAGFTAPLVCQGGTGRLARVGECNDPQARRDSRSVVEEYAPPRGEARAE